MKKLFLIPIVFISFLTHAQIQFGTWRTTTGNTDYHFLTRDGGGTAVYINQISTDASKAILRLSSGTATPNQNVRFTVENNGFVGIGVIDPSQRLEVNGTTLSTTFRSTLNNTNYHHLTRDGGGAALYINQVQSNSTYPILRLSSGTSDPNQNVRFTVENNGSVGIGTINTGSYKLAVNGSIRSKEVKVEANWSDFVFYDNYELRTLEEVEQHINEKGHLPEIPSEAEITENGINLGEMDAKLLQKIEELTLYMIEMNKRMGQLEQENSELKKEVSALKNE
ncbi:hypothetical protein SAMN04488029_3185 [Reichenbachiella faecimaris]|uniref:Uncharacterized protein n=1 Tax=Reichenbachiella faecimaris TaxID=692418 RepID=A0A1W2GK04_REIFA|nr:hypothetical protein [Reichenbachiella faecimaris]SMD37003.1 hypothetical protein SAMN04488029_3185 [Reichenbachiella faecimaris]